MYLTILALIRTLMRLIFWLSLLLLLDGVLAYCLSVLWNAITLTPFRMPSTFSWHIFVGIILFNITYLTYSIISQLKKNQAKGEN